MSTDILLWIGTLLFCATMLIFAAMRRADGGSEGEAIDYSDHPAFDGLTANGGVDLGDGWSLGGSDSD